MDLKILGIKLTPLKIIPSDKGSVMHALKNFEEDFQKFGEAYFSTIAQGTVKGWKKHTQMISNLVVPCGEILFVFYDDRKDSPSFGHFEEVVLSPKNYQRLNVQPGIWMAFKGIDKDLNLLLNLSNIPHDPSEFQVLDLDNDRINYKFG